MDITMTIGWTKSEVVDGSLVYSSFMGYEHGAKQHTETITVDVPEHLLHEWHLRGYHRDEMLAEFVFAATNAPTHVAGSLDERIHNAIAATGYRGHGAHWSFSTGDTVTIGNVMLECQAVGFRRRLTERDLFVFTEFITGGSTHPTDNRRNVLAIRLGRELGCVEDVLAIIKAKRRRSLTQAIIWQRRWATRISRRPQRSRNHDSWAIREHYVRADAIDYAHHLGYGHAVRAEHGIDDHPYNKRKVTA